MGKSSRWLFVCAGVVVLSFPSFGAGAAPSDTKTSPAESEIDLKWAVAIPMRDGVKLNATLYLPRDLPKPVPAVFTLTPYISDTYHERAMYFARHGYVFALVDVRGRGNS